MPILIKDAHFERKAGQEKVNRGHKSLAKTVQELAEERLAELHTGQYLPPAPDPEPKTDQPASSAA